MKWFRLIVLFAICFTSCDDEANNANDVKITRDDLVNRTVATEKAEKRQIKKYIERHQWEMSETETGLYYQILDSHSTDTTKIRTGMNVHVSYEIQLLTGDTVYSSKGNGLVTFRVGMSQVETGIHEGVQLMHVGDKARFIIPSFLAHGFTGDQAKIPGNMPIIVTMQVLRLS